MSARVIPPGWYVDQAGLLRWWDGTRWTPYAAVLPARSAPWTPAPPRRPQPIEPRLIEPGTLDPGVAGRVRTWQVVLVGVAALTVIVTVAWLLAVYASDPRLG